MPLSKNDLTFRSQLFLVLKLMPSPRWKLVVDVGLAPTSNDSNIDPDTDNKIRELDSLIEAHMPHDKDSPLASLLPGFTSLRLLLVKRSRSDRENELLQSALDSFEKYRSSGQPDANAVGMTARDFMIKSRQQTMSANRTSTSNSQGAHVSSFVHEQQPPNHQTQDVSQQQQQREFIPQDVSQPGVAPCLVQQVPPHQQLPVQQENLANTQNSSNLMNAAVAGYFSQYKISEVSDDNQEMTSGYSFPVSPTLQVLAGQSMVSPFLTGLDSQGDIPPFNMNASQNDCQHFQGL